MKKIFTKAMRATRLMTTMIALVASTGAAFAGGDGYFSYFADLIAYPSGAGTVYADASGMTVPQFDGVEFKDFTVPSGQVEVKYVAQGSMMGYNAIATPAKGWIFAGFSGAKKDAEGNPVFCDSISTRENPGYLSVSATAKSDDETSALANFPLVSDTTHYALFTHVLAYVADGQTTLGTTKSSKVCNDMGDEVTLTAVPNPDDATAKFAYWVNKTTDEKITINPIKLTVSDTVRYEAHFTSDNAINVKFPENGGAITFYNESGFDIPTGVNILNFNYQPDYVSDWSGEIVKGDSLRYNTDKKMFYQVPDTTGYNLYPKEAYILAGKGETTFVKNDNKPLEQTTSQLQWSGAEGKKVSEMALSSHYYSVDTEKQEFHLLANDAVIAPNSVYLALTNERYQTFGITDAPQVIYWIDSASSSTGIENIAADKAQTSKKQGIYTLSGQKLERITKTGLYIVNGEKRFYLVK